MERIETAIVGGGQAGLATSYYLTQHRREHVVLEAAPHVADPWRNGRWDSFTLVTPNWSVMMPGAEYDEPDRDGYMPRQQIVSYFERYVERFRVPVRYNARVNSIEPMDGRGYRIQMPDASLEATNVVLATGFEQSPKVPAFAAGFAPDIAQLHSSRYRNPESLPDGGVLVVGSAQSGCQIAEELYQSGRQVYLATGSAGRAPRRYRGKDTVEWLYRIGFFGITPDKLPVPKEHFAAPHVSGAKGGHTLNLHQFAADGVILLGHLIGAAGNSVRLAPDLHQNLAKADGFEEMVQKMIDGYIQGNGLDAPPDELPQLRHGYEQPVVEELDLRDAGISTVIWATGYTCDFGLVKLPMLDGTGFPLQERGVSRHAGFYIVGMPWMPSLGTGTLLGVGESARHVVDTIVGARAEARAA